MVKANVMFANEARRKRHERHLTQKALADLIGCGQSAIAHIEKGELNVLSPVKLKLLCKELGLSFPTAPVIATALSFCGNSDCPLGWRDVVNGNLVIQPVMFRIEAEAMRFCKACGQLLLATCQEPSCLAEPQEGAAFCVNCGNALVKTERHQQMGDLEDYKERMNQHHREYRIAASAIEIL